MTSVAVLVLTGCAMVCSAKPSRVLARVVSLAMCAILAAILSGRDGGHESSCGQRLGLFEYVSLLYGEPLLYRAAVESGAAQIRWQHTAVGRCMEPLLLLTADI